MAELAVLNIAKSLLPQLSTLAKDELLLWYNSKTELEKLENTIRTIKDVLHDAEQKQATNDAVRGWLSRLRDEMYKADDLFDTISTRALRKRLMDGGKMKKEMKLFFSKSNQFVFIFKTAHKVKEIRERLDGMEKDSKLLNLIKSTREDERLTMKRDEQHSYIPEDEVIGRDKDKEELVRLLMADGVGKSVSVIAVVGIGGQGKTALAQLLYNAKEIEEFFDLRLWACINYFSNLENALEKIVGIKTSTLDELQKKLRGKIQGKKFLLVIDDVWDDCRENWDHLRRLLDAGERGSKILMTTRSETIANNLATITPHYALGELSYEDAWILFKKRAFDSNREEVNQSKEELGRYIVKKCPKVPLAIRTIGSFLYNKDEKKWSEFADKELMTIMSPHKNLIMQALKISYDDLPSPLKHCFAYCSLFPKDYKIDKTTLIHLWMAQGLLETSNENPTLEDVGESYFSYLVQRCFFQNVTEEEEGDDVIVSCMMHDFFHDLAVQIAANECLTMKVPDDIGEKIPRHLLVGEINDFVLRCKGLRSLVSLYMGFVEKTLLDGVLMNLTSLRTLCLRYLEIEEIPSSIGKLTHLRYLDLRESKELKRLPDALCKLQNLLILRLGGCSNLIELPDQLQKLLSLRYLEIEGCRMLNRMPSRLEEMTSLVNLDRLIVSKDHGGLRCLERLNNLTGAIHIELPQGRWKNCVADAKDSMLTRKTQLRSLFIQWKSEELPETDDELDAVLPETDDELEAVRPETDDELEAVLPKTDELDAVLYRLQPSNNINLLEVDNFFGAKLPDWLSSLSNLVKLAIKNCSRCPKLPNLRHLSQLKRLELSGLPLEYLENEICDESGSFFPSLESIHIKLMKNLKGWCRPIGEELSGAQELCFPRLSSLTIMSCPHLASFPLCPVVESAFISNVNVKVVTQLMRSPKAIPNSKNLPSGSKLYDLSLWEINDVSFLQDELKHLSSLRRLSIKCCSNFDRYSLLSLLEQLPLLESLVFQESRLRTYLLSNDENMEKDGMPWILLPRLKSLVFEFGSDSQGAHLVKGLHHLTRLEELTICGKVPNDKEVRWTAPPNLKHLSLWKNERENLNGLIQQLNKLRSLLIGVSGFDEHELDELPWEDLKCLRDLTFLSSQKIKSLPAKCEHVPALEGLSIAYCENLTSLPGWISRLTSLHILGCPNLQDKCRKPVGSYWPIIQNIPDCTLNFWD